MQKIYFLPIGLSCNDLGIQLAPRIFILTYVCLTVSAARLDIYQTAIFYRDHFATLQNPYV
jgi:hypothetical protein